ncbi:sugar ABC transporter substrate-binding protein [Arthrobacter sedimenti]|uniref:sugar ABC transporter substrate-binding protein n=1 Tax=Arthrobacter sedimenti TaxID=2694931 RepID=UPI000B3627AC|nr:substrate-binding domain-containing protein [Arthrobacter sedimenti]OUM43303.1 hypothetical protein B8W73_05135 [Arthrobacter agilis]
MKSSTTARPALKSAGILSTFALAALALAGCGAAAPTAGGTATGGAASTSCSVEGEPFSTDDAEDSIEYSELENSLGAVPEAPEDTQIGSIMKFLGNQYWVALSDGQKAAAEKYGVGVDVQAAATESDQVGQLNAAETMLQKKYTMLVSPQTDTNLCPAVEKAEQQDLLVVNVNDAVLPGAKQWVGPNQMQNGVSAAEFVLESAEKGDQVAVIEGQAGVYAAKQRTTGFTTTAEEGGLEVVASVPGDWDIAKARDAATTIISQYPDIAAIYANNDGMALGVAEAVNAAGKKGQIMVIGTDGVEAAYDAIRAGDLTATVDSYPYLTGQVSVNVAVRLLGGQDVPRAVYTPQALITTENVDDAPPTLD